LTGRTVRRLLAAVAATGLIATAAGMPASAAPVRDTGHVAAGALARSLVDRNGDRISDGLGRAIDRADVSKRFDVVVTFDTRAAASSARHDVAARVDRTFTLIHGFEAHLIAGQILAMALRPGVIRVEQNFAVHALMDAADRDFGTEAARTDFGVTGAGVEVCVIDTGADPNHEQLDSKAPIPFLDLINGHATAYDDHTEGHGTHVASIAVGDGVGGTSAAAHNGVAPGAALSVVKALDSTGNGADGLAVTGVQWCANRPSVDVISMSLGSDLPSDGLDAISQAVDAAVQDKGKVVVAAAGNSGDLQSTITAPGSATGAITVGAGAGWSSPFEGPYLAAFSSRGPTANDRIKPDVVSPGVGISAAKAGTTAGYVSYSGTSMATPFVAGTAALILAKQPGWTPAQVRSAIEGTALDVGPAGKDNDWGSGLLDGYAAVATAAGGSGETPFPAHTRFSGSVDGTGVWTSTFALGSGDLDAPIAATLTLDGEFECLDLGPLGCFPIGWAPDLDAQLLDPNNAVIAESTCPLTDDPEACVWGRQETLHATPTLAGTYTITVQSFDGNPGTFAVDLFHGPVGSGSPPPPPPPPPSVHVGDLDDTSSLLTTGWKAQVRILVHDGSDAIVAGAVVTGTWPNGTKASCTTNVNGTCRIGRNLAKSKASIVFTVTKVVSAVGAYAPLDNHDPDGDSTGTKITLRRP
jgi:serine protease AprX